MASTKTKLTYENYMKTPDDERYELFGRGVVGYGASTAYGSSVRLG